MAGELNGTLVLIQKNGTVIDGQMESTVTYGGTPIDISNKTYEDWVTMIDDELSSQQITIAGTFVYNNDTTYEEVKAEAFDGKQDTYTFTFASTGETLTGLFVPTGVSDSAPQGDKVTTSVTFMSSGPVTRTPQTA